jgi:hypothetical protein
MFVPKASEFMRPSGDYFFFFGRVWFITWNAKELFKVRYNGKERLGSTCE